MGQLGYSSDDGLALSAQARALWGKTDRDVGEEWLPLYVHMSDSALVAEKIWDEWLPEGTWEIIASNFNGDATLAKRVTVFLAGIHDLGALLRLVCKDVFELAAVDEASLDVAGGVGEAHGVAAQGLEPAVDGFGGSVA